MIPFQRALARPVLPAGVGFPLCKAGIGLVPVIGLEDNGSLRGWLDRDDRAHHRSLGVRIAPSTTVRAGTSCGMCRRSHFHSTVRVRRIRYKAIPNISCGVRSTFHSNDLPLLLSSMLSHPLTSPSATVPIVSNRIGEPDTGRREGLAQTEHEAAGKVRILPPVDHFIADQRIDLTGLNLQAAADRRNVLCIESPGNPVQYCPLPGWKFVRARENLDWAPKFSRARKPNPIRGTPCRRPAVQTRAAPLAARTNSPAYRKYAVD